MELDDYYPDFDILNEPETTEFVLGSAKLKLHDPRKSYPGKKAKLTKYCRRSSFLKRKYPSYDSYNCSKDISRRPSDISELYSRKNSLHDSKNDTLDERLAERVLHWLDLKGKEELLKNINQLKDMEVKLSKTAKLRQDSIKRYYNNKLQQSSRKTKSTKNKNVERANTCNQVQTKPSEPVKHITIIFNKDGQPIRFNRPARNIDLCALSASPSTTRRLAGSLASARLYKSAENTRCLKSSYQKAKESGGNKSLSAHRRLDTVADLTNSNLQKRLLDNTLQANFNNLHDAKKQLHIFMPTLPKKGLTRNPNNNCNNNNVEDLGISELSHNFSELCRI